MNKKLIGVLLVLLSLILLFFIVKVVDKNMTVKSLEENGYTSLYGSNTTFTKDVELSDGRIVKLYYRVDILKEDLLYTEDPSVDYNASANLFNSKETGCQYNINESAEFILLETSPLSCASAEVDTVLFNEIMNEYELVK